MTSPVFDLPLVTGHPQVDAHNHGPGYGTSVGGTPGYAPGVGGGRGVATTGVGGGGTAVGGTVVGSLVAGGAVVADAAVGSGGKDVAVAVGVTVGGMSDGVTWITPGVRVGTSVGVGGVSLPQATRISTRPRITTTPSRATLARCLMSFLLHIVKLGKSIPYVAGFSKTARTGTDHVIRSIAPPSKPTPVRP